MRKERQMIPAIIDCDPGHDDVMAILLGARTMDIKGITTVFGNAALPLTTKNARYLVELADLRHIPIAAGCDRPLVRKDESSDDGAGAHGKTGLDGPEIQELEFNLHDLANHPRVQGRIIDLALDEDVTALFAAWDDDAGNPQRANEVLFGCPEPSETCSCSASRSQTSPAYHPTVSSLPLASIPSLESPMAAAVPPLPHSLLEQCHST